jgi:hypothetical protein
MLHTVSIFLTNEAFFKVVGRICRAIVDSKLPAKGW